MTRRAIRARITGRVQGVWFRGWTSETAQTLGLDGWVRNDPDGAVTALIAGPEAQVAQMLEALHQGPEAARVQTVETKIAEDPGAIGFEIRR
ncbi:acylphosphatase [Defluviimonas sp. 20V17]|uniref:Acylphosphatase n=1 Tax=Allgaiera indica TaxID=765699 RepID=A0AAN4ZYN1_9RHOB|nr:acylphosphatase [Allgaiera indica]KDB04313.1 acylphosphatase [Defluviimonas sp. 20V17]GHD99543.1 acylphosphatase [Allgaiera indica]SDW23408.1 acylphosphatase [Allgaiera indica]